MIIDSHVHLFPNIPYDMMTEINAIKALNLGKETEDKLLFKNALRW